MEWYATPLGLYYFLFIGKTLYNTFFAFIKLSFRKTILTSCNQVSIVRLLHIPYKTLSCLVF